MDAISWLKTLVLATLVAASHHTSDGGLVNGKQTNNCVSQCEDRRSLEDRPAEMTYGEACDEFQAEISCTKACPDDTRAVRATYQLMPKTYKLLEYACEPENRYKVGGWKLIVQSQEEQIEILKCMYGCAVQLEGTNHNNKCGLWSCWKACPVGDNMLKYVKTANETVFDEMENRCGNRATRAVAKSIKGHNLHEWFDLLAGTIIH